MNNKIFVTNVRVLRFLYKYEFIFYNKIKMERFRHSILSCAPCMVINSMVKVHYGGL